MNQLLKQILGIIFIIIISMYHVSFAITQEEIDNEKNEKTQINSQINDVQEKKKNVENQKSEAQKQIDSINSQIDACENKIEELDTQITHTNEKIKEMEVKLDENEKKYAEQDTLFKKRLVAMYETRNATFLDILFNSKSLTDLISNYYLISQIAEADEQVLESLITQKQKIENTKQEINNSKEELMHAKKNKENTSIELQNVKNERNNYIAELSEEEQALQKVIDELKAHENSVSSKIKQMQIEYDEQIAKMSKKTTEDSKNLTEDTNSTDSDSNGMNASSSYGFGYPVQDHRIGTNYGVAGRYWSSGYHTGIDFPVASGTQVYSVGDGKVVDTGYNAAYGNFVEIYHGNNIYSFYAHGSQIQVSSGQMVTKGQAIMLSGKSGNVTGPHLHFEIRTPGSKYANCVNPRPYLP